MLSSLISIGGLYVSKTRADFREFLQEKTEQTPLKQAQGERLRLAKEGFAFATKPQTSASSQVWHAWSLRILEAELDIHVDKEKRVKACLDHLTRVKELFRFEDPGLKKKRPRNLNDIELEYYVAEAETLLEKAKSKKE